MKKDTNLMDFVAQSFNLEGVDYKIVYTPRFYAYESGLDFTGDFIGILLSSRSGTSTFQIQVPPDQKWQCDKFPLENAPADFPYNFTFDSFKLKGVLYKVVVIEDLYREEDGLDFSDCFNGIISSEKTGTVAFELLPYGDNNWGTEADDIEIAVIDKLIEIVKKKKNEGVEIFSKALIK